MFHCIRCDRWVWPWSGLYCKACEAEISREHQELFDRIKAELRELLASTERIQKSVRSI